MSFGETTYFSEDDNDIKNNNYDGVSYYFPKKVKKCQNKQNTYLMENNDVDKFMFYYNFIHINQNMKWQ